MTIASILSRPTSGAAFGDVQGNGVACATQLVPERLLLIVGEAARGFDTLDGQPLGVLPSLELLMQWHVLTWVETVETALSL